MIPTQTLSYNDKDNITIILRGIDSEKVISKRTSSGISFTIGNGVTLILDINITLQGWSLMNNLNGRIIQVNTGGELIMNVGSKIIGNAGGGVDVNGGKFTMNEGIISGNLSWTNGGGVYVSNGIFIMNGGEISDNDAPLLNTGSGGGVYISNGTFTMNNGLISNNSSRDGGGVFVSSTFNMTGGEISKNTARYTENNTSSNKGGGGVFVNYGIFSKTGGTITGYNTSATNGNIVRNSAGGVAEIQASNVGHAIFVRTSTNNSLYRNTTVGPTVDLSYSRYGDIRSGTWNQ